MWNAIQSLLSNVSTLVERKKASPAARPHRYHNSSPGPFTVCGLVMDERDRATLSAIEDQGQWRVRLDDPYDRGGQLRAANSLLQIESPIIIWDRDLPCEDWRDEVHKLSSLPHKPCVLLLSRVVDDYLWNEVVSCGGYDVLAKPLKDVDVVRAVRLAWSYWASSATAPPRK